MFAASKTAPPAGGTPDPQFNYVTMLLHGDGTNGAQNNTFVDSSSNGYSLTRGGSLTQGSFSPYGSNWSNYFDGTPSYLTVPYNAGFDFGTGDFTVETWYYPTDIATSTSDNSICSRSPSNNSTAFALHVTSTGYVIWFGASFSAPVLTSVSTLSTNQWYHLALVRQSGTTYLYINGVLNTSTATSYNITTGSTATYVACASYSQTSSNAVRGYLSNLRIVKGTAVYTSAFTPSTTPLTAISGTSLLTCQSNRFIDNSSIAGAVTTSGTPSVQRFNPFGTSTAYSAATIGASAYNPGGSYLTTSYSGSVGSTDDFTVEGWFYVTANADNGSFVLNSGTLGIIMTQSGQKLSTYIPSVGFVVWQASALVQNTWHYIVVQRSLSVLSCYLNGTRLGTQAGATGGWTYNGAGLYLTGSNATREIGYYTDIRISTVARYAGTTMTVPTAPLASDANTTFLLSMKNGAIYDNAMMNDLETVGNAQISTSVVKYGTGSMSFPSSSYLLSDAATSNLAAFGTGDFTIEFWLYLNTTSGAQVFYDGRTAAGEGAYPTIYTSSGTLYYYVSSANRITGSGLSTSTWYHIALCRSGTSTKLFVNGSQVGSTYSDSTNYLGGAQRPMIGADGFNGGTPGGNTMNGYIDDLRITKGYARYTTTFTPPTAAFPNTGPN